MSDDLKTFDYSGFGDVDYGNDDDVEERRDYKPQMTTDRLPMPFVRHGIQYVPVVHYVPLDAIKEDKPKKVENVKPAPSFEYNEDLSKIVSKITKMKDKYTLARKSIDGQVLFFTNEEGHIFSIPKSKLDATAKTCK